MKKSAASVFGKIFAKVLLGILVVFLVGVCAYQGVIRFTDNKINENLQKEGDDDDVNSVSDKQVADRNKLVTILYTKNSGSNQFGDAMLRMFEKESREFKYVFIPSELSITVDDITYQQLQTDSDSVPQTFLLQDIPKYFADGTDQYKAANRALKAILGLKYIDYYEVASMESLVSIINLIDPVEFKVPQKMIFKNQDGINEVLRKGNQELIGNQAVGMIRYTKGYTDPVGQRAKLGVKYWKAYFKAVADLDKKDITKYYEDYYKYVDGSASYENIEPYMKEIAKTNGDLVTVSLLPGSSGEGAYVMDQAKAAAMMKDFAAAVSVKNTEDENKTDSTTNSNTDTTGKPSYSIEVINAAKIAGIAGKWQETLIAEGYNVIGVDTASEQQGDTIIYVSQEGMGEELLEVFPDAKIEVGDTGEADVRIMVGLNYAQ